MSTITLAPVAGSATVTNGNLTTPWSPSDDLLGTGAQQEIAGAHSNAVFFKIETLLDHSGIPDDGTITEVIAHLTHAGTHSTIGPGADIAVSVALNPGFGASTLATHAADFSESVDIDVTAAFLGWLVSDLASIAIGVGGSIENGVTFGYAVSAFTLEITYTPSAGIAIDSVTPNAGPVGGGTAITIAGSGFPPDARVYVGGIETVVDLVVVDPTSITVRTPPHDVGLADVVVTSADGSDRGTQTDSFLYTFVGRGIYRVRMAEGVKIRDVLNDAPNTATFTAEGAPPLSGEPVEIAITDELLFAGTILPVEQSFDTTNIRSHKWNVQCVDHTWLLNRRRPFGHWEDTPGEEIVLDVLTRFALDFTDFSFIQTGLRPVTITADGSEDMAGFLTRLAQLIGGIKWYADYVKRVHFFYVPPSADVTDPADPDAPTGRLTVTLGSTPPPEDSTPPMIHYEAYFVSFVTASRHETGLGLASNVVGPYWDAGPVQFSDLPIGPDIDGEPVVARRVYWRNLSSRDVVALFEIPNNTQTTADYGFPDYAYREMNGGYVRFYRRRRLLESEDPPRPGPSGAPTIAVGFVPPDGSASHTPGRFAARTSWLYADGVESALSPESNEIDVASDETIDVTAIETGPDVGGVPVLARYVYNAFDWPGSAPRAFVWDRSSASGMLIVPDNTGSASNNLTATPTPLGSYTYRNAYMPIRPPTLPAIVGGWVNGPSPEDDIPGPDPIVQGSPMLMEPAFTSSVDYSQVRNRVFVRGGGSTLVGAPPAGYVAIGVEDATQFDPYGGTIIIGSEVIDYDSVSGTTISLAVPLVYAHRAGEAVNLWAEMNDTDSQAILAAREGSGSDGVHESLVSDASLVTMAACQNRGRVELVMFAPPNVTARYASRDRKTRSGKTISINLIDPPFVGTLLIQEVSIDQINEYGTLVERYSVTAGTIRFTLEDFLRKVAVRTA